MDWETPVTLLLWLIFGGAALAMAGGLVIFTVIWVSGFISIRRERRARQARTLPRPSRR